MNQIKKLAGVLWILIGPVAIYFLVKTALAEVAKNPLVGTKVQWIVFVSIFTPVAFGLMIFGWYAIKGEFEHLPESSKDFERQ